MTLTKCPTCETEGKKSRLDLSEGEHVKGAVEVFFDEDQNRHVHDHTVNETVYKCSNGHTNLEHDYGHCPACPWRGDKT